VQKQVEDWRKKQTDGLKKNQLSEQKTAPKKE
jgi:hypothetical protein